MECSVCQKISWVAKTLELRGLLYLLYNVNFLAVFVSNVFYLAKTLFRNVRHAANSTDFSDARVAL